MSLLDLLIKKKGKKYFKNLLFNWLEDADPSELENPKEIANFLAEKAETFFEENFL